MTIVAMICGATDWPKVVVMSKGMTEWLAQYVDMTSGIPCERTFKDLFNLIHPEVMEKVLRDVTSLIREKVSQEVIGFDGQTERGTADKKAGIRGIHLVHAWSSDNEICLGQLKIDDKSNEITAVPKLMESLDLKGTIITADALNTQKMTVKQAIKGEADYILPVKGNQPGLLEEIKSAFKNYDDDQVAAKNLWERNLKKAHEHRDEARVQKLLTTGIPNGGASYWQEEMEKVHGRIETRSCIAITVRDLPCKNEWNGLQSFVRVCRKRIKGNKTEDSAVYYISSLSPNGEMIGKAIRKHWGVESLHWRLDVTFKQDKSRYRNRVGARNLAVLRKMALHALLKDTTMKGGIATKQCAAACNPAYRSKIIKNLF